MKLLPYTTLQTQLPERGKHVIADYDNTIVYVYQAFRPSIADYAVAHQQFGGPDYRHGRMTWIKPGFMWMMYRAGWATKPNQERILRLAVTRAGWEQILREAVHSSFQPTLYPDQEGWKEALASSDVRLQWDPDHDPYGNKLERKAIQIGLRGQTLHRFHREWLVGIHDITPFVVEQRNHQGNPMVPEERVMALPGEIIRKI
ncbi:DUF4291 domain-containing protein [Lewinella sp. W8]|uniref:DUF4291 domain-containing protein n=1 Tax=Lewinella sp. W8 TaxID=2528208 RepID=UPI00106862DC|nr:DUF4291 domain-containing protein [Lewinella sp. W8]MTB51259.1 DUF4291 family protein [Lewinella sp. W8]